MNTIQKVIEESLNFNPLLFQDYDKGTERYYTNIEKLNSHLSTTIYEILSALEEEVEGKKRHEAKTKCTGYESCDNDCICYEMVRNKTLSDIQALLKSAKESIK